MAFTVFIVPLAFSVFSNENFETIKFTLFLFFTGCALAVFILGFYGGRKSVIYNSPLFWLLGLFCGLALLSSLHSLDWVYSVFGFYYRFTNGLLFYVAFAVFLVLLIQSLDKAKFLFLIKILVLDALVISLVGFMQFWGWGYYAGPDLTLFVRPPSLLGNPNFSAMFVAAVLPYAVALLLLRPGFRSRIFFGIASFFILVGSLLFSSRGAFLALGLGAVLSLLLLWLGGFSKKIIFWMLGLIIIAAIALPLLLTQSRPSALTSIFKTPDINTDSRILAWKSAISGAREQPFLGSGPGTFVVFFEHHRLPGQGVAVGVFDDAHNLFLQMAATVGVPFVLVFLAVLSLAFYYGARSLWREKDALSLAGMLSLFVWAVMACFNPVTVPCFLLLAVVLAGLFFTRAKSAVINLGFFRSGILSILSLGLIGFALALGIGETIFYFAESAYLNQNPQSAYRLSALAKNINPTSQLYFVYYAAAEISLHKPEEQVVKDIEYMKSLHPLHTRSFVEASNLYARQYEETKNKLYLEVAAKNMEQALAIDAFDPERYGQLALYRYQLNDIPSAKSAAKESINLKKDNFLTWILLAKIYQSEKDRPGVIDALTQAFKARPDILQLKYLLGLAKNLEDVSQVPLNATSRAPDLN